jgi:hypothetical protein
MAGAGAGRGDELGGRRATGTDGTLGTPKPFFPPSSFPPCFSSLSKGLLVIRRRVSFARRRVLLARGGVLLGRVCVPFARRHAGVPRPAGGIASVPHIRGSRRRTFGSAMAYAPLEEAYLCIEEGYSLLGDSFPSLEYAYPPLAYAYPSIALRPGSGRRAALALVDASSSHDEASSSIGITDRMPSSSDRTDRCSRGWC